VADEEAESVAPEKVKAEQAEEGEEKEGMEDGGDEGPSPFSC
jgi:hypothetical protein